MACLVFYNRGHRQNNRGNYGRGDCVEVLANNQAPGSKANLPSSNLSFVQTAGDVASWEYMKEEKWDTETDPDTSEVHRVELRNKRLRRTTLFNTQPQAWLDLANQYQTRPFMTRVNIEATIVEKTGPGPGD